MSPKRRTPLLPEVTALQDALVKRPTPVPHIVVSGVPWLDVVLGGGMPVGAFSVLQAQQRGLEPSGKSTLWQRLARQQAADEAADPDRCSECWSEVGGLHSSWCSVREDQKHGRVLPPEEGEAK